MSHLGEDTHIKIRPMRPPDIAAGMRLVSLAGWNQVEADWRFFLEHRPQGCFVALCDGAVIGTVTTVGYGHRVTWISMLLVDPDHRGRGIGTGLMERAIASLADYPAVMLDATPAGKGLYERLGFRETSRLLRLTIDRLPSLGEGCAPAGKVRPARFSPGGDAKVVAALDRAAFGADRTALLRALARRAPEAAWVSGRAQRSGFCLGRDGTGYQQLGPLVAETER